MTRNEGSVDRGIRVIAGLVLLIAGIVLGMGPSLVGGVIAGIVGVVLMVTGTLGFCPAYCVLGVKTCVVKQ